MMLGKPNKIRTQTIKPFHLFEDFGVQILIADAGIRRITEIVRNTYAQCGLCHLLVLLHFVYQNMISNTHKRLLSITSLGNKQRITVCTRV